MIPYTETESGCTPRAAAGALGFERVAIAAVLFVLAVALGGWVCGA